MKLVVEASLKSADEIYNNSKDFLDD